MNSRTNTLPTDVETLQKMVLALQDKNQYLLEQFRLAQQARFGKSSEAHAGQGELFNEAEQIIDERLVEEKETTHKKTNRPKRKALPKDLTLKLKKTF